MMSNSSLWTQVYKGAAYPLDLTEAPYIQDSENSGKIVGPLLDICANYIVQDAQTTLEATKTVPTELFLNLLKAALLNNRGRTIHVLVSCWPFESLCLKSLAPKLFCSVLSLYDSAHHNRETKMGINFTSLLGHYFAQSLKMNSSIKLRYLDISGFVTVGVTLDYLLCYCLLAHNEVQRKKAISAYNSLQEDKDRHYQADQCIPDGSFCVKLDLFLNSVNTHTELCKALVVSKPTTSTFKLFVEKLDATLLGDVKLKVLLDLLDPKYLLSLRLQFNSLGEHGILHLADSIARLSNLTALDLSCNGIQFFLSQHSCDTVATMLSSLPSLKRLDLSSNRLKTRLRHLLCNLPQPLEYLAVVGCSLAVSDLTYLSLSHHTAGLCELDLSENWAVGRNYRSLLKLLEKLCHRLLVLEVQNCALGDPQVTDMLLTLPKLTNIQYLNLSCNNLSWDTSVACVKMATNLLSLKALQISFPRECNVEAGTEVEEAVSSKTNFASLMRNFIQEEKSKTGFSFDLSLTEN